jgi:hypothetical protein
MTLRKPTVYYELISLKVLHIEFWHPLKDLQVTQEHTFEALCKQDVITD